VWPAARDIGASLPCGGTAESRSGTLPTSILLAIIAYLFTADTAVTVVHGHPLGIHTSQQEPVVGAHVLHRHGQATGTLRTRAIRETLGEGVTRRCAST